MKSLIRLLSLIALLFPVKALPENGARTDIDYDILVQGGALGERTRHDFGNRGNYDQKCEALREARQRACLVLDTTDLEDAESDSELDLDCYNDCREFCEELDPNDTTFEERQCIEENCLEGGSFGCG